MIQHLQIQVDVEPEHPKMGHLVQAAAEKANRILNAKRLGLRTFAVPTRRFRQSGTSGSSFAEWPFHARLSPSNLQRHADLADATGRQIHGRVSPGSAKVGFLELCKNPSLCAEVMVTAVQKLGVDAAIIFSDLLPILEPMGMDLEFAAGDGPVIHNPLRTSRDIDRVVPWSRWNHSNLWLTQCV